MNTCSACGEKLPAGATKCPLCLVPVQPEEEEVYNLESTSETIPAEWEGGAVYTLEFPARCPHCRELVRSLRVLRLKRSQVSFTSPLPRGGRAIVCSACQGIISADVSTL
jgi:Double zinc ribbon